MPNTQFYRPGGFGEDLTSTRRCRGDRCTCVTRREHSHSQSTSLRGGCTEKAIRYQLDATPKTQTLVVRPAEKLFLDALPDFCTCRVHRVLNLMCVVLRRDSDIWIAVGIVLMCLTPSLGLLRG